MAPSRSNSNRSGPPPYSRSRSGSQPPSYDEKPRRPEPARTRDYDQPCWREGMNYAAQKAVEKFSSDKEKGNGPLQRYDKAVDAWAEVGQVNPLLQLVRLAGVTNLMMLIWSMTCGDVAKAVKLSAKVRDEQGQLDPGNKIAKALRRRHFFIEIISIAPPLKFIRIAWMFFNYVRDTCCCCGQDEDSRGYYADRYQREMEDKL